MAQALYTTEVSLCHQALCTLGGRVGAGDKEEPPLWADDVHVPAGGGIRQMSLFEKPGDRAGEGPGPSPHVTLSSTPLPQSWRRAGLGSRRPVLA